MGFLRKLQRPVASPPGRTDVVDVQLRKEFPALHDHLTRTADDDGVPRQTCSLTLFGASGCLKAFLNDRDSAGSLAVSADSFLGLLKALEAELQSDAPSWFWREPPNGHSQKSRKKSS